MIKIIPLIFLYGCFGGKIYKKNMLPSESLCVDGLVTNMESNGCKSLYFGFANNKDTIKLRCTYSIDDNIWTKNDFFIYNKSYDTHMSLENKICEDLYIKLYMGD